ncbi:MAG: hypothetical protein JW909_07010 [Planctomycetes bacterium]|nr:hypothetical protein [Planctomycetota bacterium]
MAMTLKEMNLRVFSGEPVPHVFFQPRFEPWVAWNKLFNSLPEEVKHLDLRQIYDLVGASMRTVHYYTGQPGPIVSSFTDEVAVSHKKDGGIMETRYDTPHGPLFSKQKFTEDQTWRTIEFPAKKKEDLPALKWLIEREVISFSADNFRQGAEFIGERGEPSFWVPKSPYFALAQQWMKYEDFIFAMMDAAPEMLDIMKVIDEGYDRVYEELISSGMVRIINFGENIAMAYLSPQYFEEHCLPWYEKRSNQLRRAGIYTHIHIDGYFRPLLPYLKTMPFDGLEALTPEPQGDVSIDEIKEHIGDKVLLDGIPAVYFLEHHSEELLQECVEKLVKLFHPRLILGISDELPEAATEVGFERLKRVSEYARSCKD